MPAANDLCEPVLRPDCELATPEALVDHERPIRIGAVAEVERRRARVSGDVLDPAFQGDIPVSGEATPFSARHTARGTQGVCPRVGAAF
jgi:hypothetical protein